MERLAAGSSARLGASPPAPGRLAGWNTPGHMPAQITVRQAAEILGVSRQTVREWIHRGRLPGARQLNPLHSRSPFLIPADQVVKLQALRRQTAPQPRIPPLPPLTDARPLSNEECLALICRARWPPDGQATCHRCQSSRVRLEVTPRGHRIHTCCDCGARFSALRGTLFYRTHIPLPFWLYLVFHCDPRRFHHGSSTALARRLGMPPGTVSRIVRTLRAARKRPEHTPYLERLVSLLDAEAPRVNALELSQYSRRVRRRRRSTSAAPSRRPPALRRRPRSPRQDDILNAYLRRIQW